MKKIFVLWALLFAVIAQSSEPYRIRNEADARKSPYDNITLGVPAFSEDLIIIDRAGFCVGFSKKYKVPIWVSYTITAQKVIRQLVSRSNRFKPDPAISGYTSTPADYGQSGFDRGHLAPARDMAYSEETMKESFYMSNIAPQERRFNRTVWRFLEAGIRNAAIHEQKISIVTGSIFFSGEPVQYIGNGVAIPHAFYKVVLDLTEPLKAIGFILKNEPSKQNFTVFACSVDEVEKVTGLNFFNRLPVDREKVLEAVYTIKEWNFSTIE